MSRIWIVMLGLTVLTAGCQTTATGGGTAAGGEHAAHCEKLLLRVDQLVGTYSVTVQRAACTGNNPHKKELWTTIGTGEVDGYPGKFRMSAGGKPEPGAAREIFLLDGSPVEVSQEPGTHLVVKVVPELQNTARVVGAYVQVTPAGGYMETFSVPFDLKCDMGRVYQVYARDLPPPVSAEGVSGPVE